MSPKYLILLGSSNLCQGFPRPLIKAGYAKNPKGHILMQIEARKPQNYRLGVRP